MTGERTLTIKDRTGKFRWRFPLALGAGLLLILLSPLTAVAGFVTVQPGQVFFDRRSATTGSKLAWTWDASDSVAFSVSRLGDPGNLIYGSEGTMDMGYITVPSDDVYVLLWYNPSNSSVVLNYASSIEPGSGSALLLVAVVSVLAVTIFLGLILMRWKKSEKGKESDSHDKESSSPPVRGMEIPPPMPPPPSHPPPPPIQPTQGQVRPVDVRFCRQCGSGVAKGSSFCSICGSRLE